MASTGIYLNDNVLKYDDYFNDSVTVRFNEHHYATIPCKAHGKGVELKYPLLSITSKTPVAFFITWGSENFRSICGYYKFADPELNKFIGVGNWFKLRNL